MSIQDSNLPSNKKFGSFFSFIFLGLIIISYTYEYPRILIISSIVFFFTLLTTIFKPSLLMPFNRLWMLFGFLLGKIVSPIILGLIFYLFITPIAIILRIFGRDELHLDINNKDTFWKQRFEKIKKSSLKNQF